MLISDSLIVTIVLIKRIMFIVQKSFQFRVFSSSFIILNTLFSVLLLYVFGLEFLVYGFKNLKPET
ncbi:MAG: hypothetical protein COS14_03390 [Bacteroidetes bacterium CG02_land_8_20_14_3_00_31_25]|nr:MAG: hypothetical protein COS14_03390 [Bacteroidetes bacterium CG02_land_8_20_14_3_00_31_25]